MDNTRTMQHITAALSLLALLVAFSAMQTFFAGRAAAPKETPAAAPHPFDGVRVSAKAAYVYDVRTGKPLFAKNEEVQLPLASLTKLMTALIALEQLGGDAEVAIGKKSIQVEGDSGFKPGERWNIKKLIEYTLITSSNDGAHAIAAAAGAMGESAFAEHMSERSRALGMTQTYFINATGLDQGNASGGYGSARDVATLLAHILRTHPEVLDGTTEEKIALKSASKVHTAKNTNQTVGEVPGLIGSKTGFTDLAGGNLAIIFDAGLNHPVVAVVLGSTSDGRFEDILTLSALTREALAANASAALRP
jgi:D-alanyl-D-alanine carboxypeptidase